MSDYGLNRLLFDSARKHRMTEGMSDADLAGYDLTEEEREAARAGDLERLYRLGANPYLIRRVFRPRFSI
jgi:hypothetical protein